MDYKEGQVEKILGELGKKIDELVETAKDKQGKIKDDLQDTIDELKDRKTKIEEEFKDLRENSGDKWEQSRPHLTNALNEVKEAVKILFA